MITELTIYERQIPNFKKACAQLNIEYEIIQELMEGNRYRLKMTLDNDLYYLGYFMAGEQALETINGIKF